MAKEDKLPHSFVRQHLKEDCYLYPHTPEKLAYFCLHLLHGYKVYKKTHTDEAGSLSYEDFARNVIGRHNLNFLSETEARRKTYFKDDNYLAKLIVNLVNSHANKSDVDHAFTFVNPFDDMRIDKLKEIINGYYQFIKDDQDTFLKQYSFRIIKVFISGLRLLSIANYNDSFIVWRSLLETVANFKIFLKSNVKAQNLYLTRKNDMKIIIGIKEASSEEKNTINEQTQNRNNRKNATWWEKQRFQWVNHLFGKKEELSMKNIFIKAGLINYYAHYQIASLFTHEYFLNENDFKTISLLDYLITLYWKTFELIRNDLIKLFNKSRDDLKKIASFESEMRKLISCTQEIFNEFSLGLN
ncbi:MAG: DUF5677 domain-containing protein [Bacilli bacterium]|nr:hypothetical protein [Erysipelotrichia bacterium]